MTIEEEIGTLRDENLRLKRELEEKTVILSDLKEKLNIQSKSFTELNNYSFELANQSDDEVFAFIVNRFKSFFDVKEVWISIYDEKNRELILKATTLSEQDNLKVVKRLGTEMLGFKTPVSPQVYKTLIDMGIGEPSSLHEISFGSIPVLISSSLEKIFRVGWFQGVTLTDKGKLFGGLVVAGYLKQNPLQKEELKTFTEITSNVLRRRQVEKELFLSEAKFREFSDLIPQLIFEANVKGGITFVNQFGLNLLGYTREDFQSGLNVFDLIPESDYNSVEESFRNSLAGSGPVPREFGVIRKDGIIIPLLLHAVAYTEKNEVRGIRGTGMDISEIREAKELLSIERNLLRALIDNIPDRIYAKDKSSRFIICNEALVKRMGKDTADEVIGKSDLELLERERAMGYLADEQNIIRTGIPVINKEETVVFRSGQLRWSLSTKVPLRNSHGEIVGIVGIGRDITERKIAETELENKNLLLQKIIAERDKLFSIIAHDLKSPFNYFLGFTELISDQIDSMSPEKIKELTSTMKKSAVNLYSLLENLLEWAKMQRGQMEFKPEKFALGEKVKTCVDLIAGPAAKKNISVSYDIPGDLSIVADSHMFDAIIRNLVSNAIKFTRHGGKIFISGSAGENGKVEIMVSDTGIGMDSEMLSNLFVANDLTRRKGTDAEPSTGLGLLLCKEFVEKHGGSITVKSDEGKGSTFIISLPVNC